MLNVIFKIFTKVINNRVVKLAKKIISPVQTAFIKGRNILDGVVLLHETMHEVKSKKLDAVFFKVDFEKAYDKINWDFVFDILRMKGFPEKFIGWVRKSVEIGKVAVMVNDKIGHFFATKKGLRQGDPFSPILFNIAVDLVSVLVERAQENGLIKPLIPNLVEGGLSMLQYADDISSCFRMTLSLLGT